METPEEFLMKYGISSDTTIGVEGDIPLTELLKEYASQALRIQDVSGNERSGVALPLTDEEIENKVQEDYEQYGMSYPEHGIRLAKWARDFKRQ